MPKLFSPYSDNIVFYDGEFTTLEPYTGELLSVGMIKPNGEELYLEIEQKGQVNDWVMEHVIPYLSGNPLPRGEAKDRITTFLGKSQPHLVCFVPQYDMLFLHKLFGVRDGTQENLPYHWMPFDLASIFFSLNMNPREYSEEDSDLLAAIGVDAKKYQKHNALDDARLLKETYEKMIL